MPTRDAFGTAPDGTPVERFTFSNARGVEISVITFGGIIVSLRTPDRDGVMDDVVLGHDDVEGYLRSAQYFGAIVGRYANRIARGRFTLGGVEYRLAQNNGRNHLHGGERGFDGGKLITGRKRHLAVDTPGLLLAVAVTTAKRDDGAAAPQVLCQLSVAKFPRLRK